ncbi:MAG: hypothetical protein AAF203_09295, partial [Pseudomonadota bacterium]
EAVKMEVLRQASDSFNSEKRYRKGLENLSDRPLATIDGYCVIKLPFYALGAKNKKFPLAIYCRQPHVGRVWANKVFFKEANIKQSDFFGSVCDGSDVKLLMPEVEPLLPEKFNFNPGEVNSFQLGREFQEKFLAGDKDVVPNLVKHLCQNLKHDDQKAYRGQTFETLDDAVDGIINLLCSDPYRYMNYCEAFGWLAQNGYSMSAENIDKLNDIAQVIFKMPKSEWDGDGSELPRIRRGLYIIPWLKAPLRQKVWNEQVKSSYFGNEALGFVATLMPLKDLEANWGRLMLKSAQWTWQELNGRVSDDLTLTKDQRAIYEKLKKTPGFLRQRSTSIKLRSQTLKWSLPRFTKRDRYWL